jgi:sugar phosphate isomerase/epimerase
MKRREFLVGAAASAGAAITSRGWAQSRDQDKLARIAIMSLSFGNILRNANQPDDPARTLDLMDIGQMYADRFGVHNVELQHSHIPSIEETWLQEFRARLAKTKSQVTNINLEFGALNISAPEPVLRLEAIDLTKRWIEHAVTLGAPRVMINQGALTQENKGIAIEALKAMNDYGKSKKIMVGVENRGGIRGAARSASVAPPPPAPGGPPDYLLLVEIIRGAGAYANCDLGNFPDQATQHSGIRAMFPLNDGNCHVKLTHDLSAAFALIKELGYKGLFSIEAGTRMGPDPYDNTQKILDAILANI